MAKIQERPSRRVRALLEVESARTGRPFEELFQLWLEVQVKAQVERKRARKMAAVWRAQRSREAKARANPGATQERLEARELRALEAEQRRQEKGKKGARRRHRAKSLRTKAARAEQQRRRRAKQKELARAGLEAHLELMQEIALDPGWKPKYKLRVVGESAFLVERDGDDYGLDNQ